ncbi:prisilkin-39-like [Penaeus indicus]|uniref:prisilkin-39-like n=1 Tax=Penaeus indicus TaxID=29960 RepID=UPI00300D7402
MKSRSHFRLAWQQQLILECSSYDRRHADQLKRSGIQNSELPASNICRGTASAPPSFRLLRADSVTVAAPAEAFIVETKIIVPVRCDLVLISIQMGPVYKHPQTKRDRTVTAGEASAMTPFLFTVSTALLCSHAFAASTYLGIAQGTPLGGFSQHGTLHGSFVPGGLFNNGASLVNHGLPLGHLPGPIYGNRGYLDYAYGTGSHFGYPYGKARFLKYLYGNQLGLGNPYSVLPNVRVGGVSEAEDERLSSSGSNNQNVDSTRTGIRGLHSSPIAGLGGFPSALLPHTSSVAFGTYPYALGPHTSIAGFGGFPYGAGHHTSVAAVSGILPNVGATGAFPYGLQPHIPIDHLTGFPYGVGPQSPIAGSTGFHTGLEPHTSVAGVGGLSPYLGPYAAGAGFGRFNTAFGQNTPNAAIRSRTSANMSSGNKNKQEAQKQ